MNKPLLTVLALVAATAAFTLSAQNGAPASPAGAVSASSVIPDILVEGFKGYQTGGYSAATSIWQRSSMLALDPLTVQNLNNQLSALSNQTGPFVSAEVVRMVTLSNSVREVYVSVRCQHGALFMAFTCVKLPDHWIVTVINADKDPAKVIPTNVMGGL